MVLVDGVEIELKRCLTQDCLTGSLVPGGTQSVGGSVSGKEINESAIVELMVVIIDGVEIELRCCLTQDCLTGSMIRR